MPEHTPTAYASNLTDAAWHLLQPIFCPEDRRVHRKYEVRAMLDAVLYVMRTGCPWRMLPSDFPRWNAVYRQQQRWQIAGFLDAAMQHLQPVRHGADYAPTLGVVDSTFVEGAYGGEAVGISGHKRAHGTSIHVIIDKESFPLFVTVAPSNRPDSVVTQEFLPNFAQRYPSVRIILADKAYRGEKMATAAAQLDITLDVSSPPLKPPGNFAPQPTRWKIEQYFGWLFRWRRLAKNWCSSADGFLRDVRWAMLGIALQRYTKHSPPGQPLCV